VAQRLIKNSKLMNRQLNQLVRYFALEVLASRAANVMNINRHSAERVYYVICRCLEPPGPRSNSHSHCVNPVPHNGEQSNGNIRRKVALHLL
jgi:hypothetical protein